MPSVRIIARPSGYTSTSLPVKSVSRADDATNRRNSIGPITSTGRSSTGVLYTSTSARVSTALWEAAGEVRVAPGADDHALVPARVFGASSLPHALVVLERAPQEDVVPPADVERRGTDLLVASTGRDWTPIRVRCRVGQPVTI